VSLIITGGSGFIGSHLRKRFPLATNLDIRAAGNNWLECDVRDGVATRAIIQQLAPQAVVHLAAVPGVAALDGLETQIKGTQNVLRAAEVVGARVVLASSAAVYSLPEYDQTPIVSEYAIGKRTAELLGHTVSIPVINLRFSNVYGPPWPKGVVAALRSAAKQSTIPTLSSTTLSRDLIHVEDVCDAISCAISAEVEGSYDICTGVETTLLDLWKHLANQYDRWGSYRKGKARPCDRATSRTDPSRATAALGWTAKISLAEGLQEDGRANPSQ
jgi:UDP-glucose 4-epimerase